MFGIRPRPDWMDAGDFKDEVVLWTYDEKLAYNIVRVFYHNMAEVVPLESGDGEYITDGFGNYWLDECADCGGHLEIVRPGKVQCPECN